jgi:hypothetical protein
MSSLVYSRRSLAKKGFIVNDKGVLVVHDRFTFWKLFVLLRQRGLDPDQALEFVFANCSLSSLVFQECIENKLYETVEEFVLCQHVIDDSEITFLVN